MVMSQGKTNALMCFKGEGGKEPQCFLYFVFSQALFHLIGAELWFVGNNPGKRLCLLGSCVLQGGTAWAVPEESCGVAAMAQLSSGGYGEKDTPLRIKGVKPWYGSSI